jgi:CelD/BcsL family acetyltransferase involved in cellulose biosynthesis
MSERGKMISVGKPYSVKIVESAHGFARLEREWDGLLQEGAGFAVFQTWEWQFTWWQSFGGELFIIVIFDKQELLAILPFIRKKRLTFYILTLIGAPDSDYLNFIIKEGFETRILTFFFDDFLNTHKKICIIELPSINETSPVFSPVIL